MEQEHQRPRAMHLGEVQVELVALPQHDKAQVQFCIKSGGDVTHTIEFGKERVLPETVFGAVNDATATDEFPHVVIALNVDTAAIGQAADTAAGSQASISTLRPCTAFAVRGNGLFQGTWEEVVKQSNDCNMMIKAPLAVLCFIAGVSLTLVVVANLFSVWLYILPLLCLSIFGGVLLSIHIVCTMWVDMCVESSCPVNIGRFVVWALVTCVEATLGIFVNGSLVMMFIIFLGLNLPMDLLLARCGVRPARTIWPFYRMLGFQGGKVPTLTLTVELADGGLDQEVVALMESNMYFAPGRWS